MVFGLFFIYIKHKSNIILPKGADHITNKERFLSLCEDIHREGLGELLAWLERSDFYTAPSSTRFHGNYPGGLLEHSLNVYDELKRLMEVYENELRAMEKHVTEETIRIVTLFHDLCKVNFYVSEKRNRKNELGQWEQYDAYSVREKFCYGGHGAKSVFLLQNFIRITPEEATAIHCHMGGFSEEPRSVSNAFEQSPLAWLASVADQSATYIREHKEET